MTPLRRASYVLRFLGPRFVCLRGRIYLSKALGTARRIYRPRPWDSINLQDITRPETPTDPAQYAAFKRANPPPFLFSLGQPPEIPAAIRDAPPERQPPLSERLRLLCENRCVYFFHTRSPSPIDWHTNALHGTRSTPDQLWCDLPDFLPDQGDARTLWEPARAAWAIDLARARARGLTVDAAALYWHWSDSWMRASPPFQGLHWKCGQESSVRLIALTLGFWGLADAPTTTPERWLQFARLAWATGYRVAHHIHYAVSQKNNHALSEACGLLLVSHLFPEFIDSARWNALARRILTRELRRQIYPDGTYLQHSMNYHRVMLHVALLALRLAELSGRPLPRDLYQRLGHCSEFLYQMMEPATGRLPQYGHNDGSNVLPLNECDFTDYRPVVQATHYLVHRTRRLPAGPWDEDLLWLFGGQALAEPPPRSAAPQSSAFDAGGYYTLRRTDTWAMVRCHTYRDRPGQCDPLHLDLWWRGQNVLTDCGSYLYYAPGRPDLEYYFKSIAAHNTVEIDGADPLELVSRFLWLPWPRARRLGYQPAGQDALWFEGEHYAYDRAPWRVVHRRLVISLSDETWAIVDDLLGEGAHQFVLRWHMLDAPFELDREQGRLRLRTPAGDLWVSIAAQPSGDQQLEVLRGVDGPDRVQGWAAPYYADRQPIPTLQLTSRSALPLRLLTVVSPRESAARSLGIPQVESLRRHTFPC